MKTVIKVENISKKYVIKHNIQNEDSFPRAVINSFKNVVYKVTHPTQKSMYDTQTQEEFWALKDIDFEVKQGDKIGIIGRNGAGKSTLLKVLSKITEPTTGKISVNGRIASLLEVGTGFHPELSGRENIYLNGSILGMTRQEIKSKFDEIVAFAEVEKFIDTPVKRYSSGMYVRLAFAIAAHLEPEILVVDEVLAVGDAAFQKKCLGKMNDISQEGRTILFVSHNMNAIEELCNSAILMKKGKLIEQSNNVRNIIQSYLSLNIENNQLSYWKNERKEYNNEYFFPNYFAIVDSDYHPLTSSVRNDEDIYILVEGNVLIRNNAISIGYVLYDEKNNELYHSTAKDMEELQNVRIEYGKNILVSKIPKRFLNEGIYRVELLLFIPNVIMLTNPGKNAPTIFFSIKGGLSDSPYWYDKRPGILAPVIPWNKIVK